ncbi:MAG: helix-turn-helix domain-containing protein [Myxococcales bacterium]|nr:helix-turn-helix domain-containing protein [Myxococcales bacterium]
MNAPAHLPTPHEAGLAQAALKLFGSLGPSVGDRTVELKPEGSSETITITLPQEALRRFLEVLAQMANGNAVTIVPIHAELTTQQAADFLNVSRPFLISLLEEKKLPFRLVGSHRRIRFADLQAFREADDKQREAVLAELSADAQLNGHGY